MAFEEELFHAAIGKPADERDAYLAEVCRHDEPLRRRIEELIISHEQAGRFLEEPPLAIDGTAMPRGGRREVSPVSATDEGETIAERYKLLERIGEGGFGIVYMAEQQEPVRRRVALKIIKLGMDTKQVIGRFEGERQTLAMMDHPNIAKVFDAGATGTGRPFFVMELVRGLPITDFCDENRLSGTDRVRLFTNVCRAVQHAHEKGVIHRDIKPNNVMVTWQDDVPVAKVIDFGVAKATEHPLTERTVFTQYAQMIGTPAYMSPEQAHLGLDVDTRTDVYSLGVLLYELLTGSTPFDTKDLMSSGYDAMRRRICEEEPPGLMARLSTLTAAETASVARLRRANPVQLRQFLRGELEWIVTKALEKDRRRRYGTAASLGDDLQRFLDGDVVTAAPPSVGYRLAKYLRRHRVAVGAATAVAVALLAGAVVSSLLAVRAYRAERVALAGRRRAEASELVVQQQLYISDMALAQRELRELNTERTIDLLEKHIPGPDDPDFRGFEWRWLWNQTHQESFALPGHSRTIRDLDFSPDGNWLVVGSEEDGTARLWNLAAEKPVWRHFGGGACNGVNFSPDGKWLVTVFATREGNMATLWDRRQPAVPVEARRFPSIYPRLRFAPDSQSLWAGSIQFDLSGRELQRFEPADGWTGQAFSRDGHTLVTMDWTGVGRIWGVPTGGLVNTLPEHYGFRDLPVKGVAMSPVDDVIVTTSMEGARLWDRTGNQLRWLPGMGTSFLGMADFSCDGGLLAVRQFFGAVHVFETRHWTQLATWPTSKGTTLAFSPSDRNLLVVGGEDGVIRGWSVASTDVVFEHPHTIVALEFSANGRVLLAGMDTGQVRFWDIASQTELMTTPATEDDPDSLRLDKSSSGDYFTVSPDSRYAAVIGPADTISIWGIEPPKRLVEFKHSQGYQYYSVAFSRTGDEIYAGAQNGDVVVWNWRNNQLRPGPKMRESGIGVKSLAVSPDGRLLATGHERDVRLWTEHDMHPRQKLNLAGNDFSPALSLAFSPNGSSVAVGTYNSDVLLWNREAPRQTTRLSHRDQVTHVAFSPAGDRLATADLSHHTRLWHLGTMETIAEFKGAVVAFSPDGTILAVGAHAPPLEDRQLAGRVTLHVAAPSSAIDRQPTELER